MSVEWEATYRTKHAVSDPADIRAVFERVHKLQTAPVTGFVDEAWLDAEYLAVLFGLEVNAVRVSLTRARDDRKIDLGDFVEIEEPRRGQGKYLYRMSAVAPLLAKMRNRICNRSGRKKK